MKAITLSRPWAWAMFHGKPVANMAIDLHESFFGDPIAISAGKLWDYWGSNLLCDLLGVTSLHRDAQRRGVIGVVIFDRVISGCHPLPGEAIPDVGGDPVRESPWYIGPFGWVAKDHTEFATPVQCRGFHSKGLWTIPDKVEAQVRRHLEGYRK